MEQQTAKLELSPDALWKRFGQFFWALFVLHLLTKIIPSLPPEGISNPGNYRILLIGNIVFGVLVAIAMAVNVGWHAYLLSKKKIYLLLGLLGLWWMGLVAIFIAYFAVQWTYYKSIGKTISTSQKVLAGILIVISLLVVFSVALTLISTPTPSTQPVAWIKMASPDGHFSVELPSNAEYSASNSPGSIETYLYSVQEQNDNVSYVVKYENYQPVAAKIGLNIEKSSQTAKQNLLKELVTKLVGELSISNSSSQFITSHGYEAIRYTGVAGPDYESANIEGVIILAGQAVYSITAIYRQGYSHGLDRILNSLVIK